jgi:hypothetical protein
VANGLALSTITVTVKDVNGNVVSGQTVQLASTGSNNALTQPSGVTDASGVATGAIASTHAETKTLTATINPGAGQVVVVQQPTVAFVGDPSTISAANSTSTASPSSNVVANGLALSTITAWTVVRDVYGNVVVASPGAARFHGLPRNTLTPLAVTDNQRSRDRHDRSPHTPRRRRSRRPSTPARARRRCATAYGGARRRSGARSAQRLERDVESRKRRRGRRLASRRSPSRS